MRKQTRKALCVLLACCMALTWCAPALAALLGDADAELQAADTDRCGPNARWSLDGESGTLTISGTGDMTDYRYNNNRYEIGYGAPWSDLTGNIRFIDIDNGITSIGDAAFVGCSVSEALIPASVKRIGAQAFRNCGSLQSVVIPDGTESVGDNAFRGSGLHSLSIPASVTSIGKGAFLDCALVYVDYQGTSAQWDAVQKGSQIFNEGSGVAPYIRCSDDASENPSGTCGDTLTWEYYPNDCLVLRGTGNIPDFSSADEVPWAAYRESMRYVVFDIASNNGGIPSLDIDVDEDKGTTSVVLTRGAERTVVATGKAGGSELQPETNENGEQIFTDAGGKTVTYSELEALYSANETYLYWEQDDEAGVFSAFTAAAQNPRGETTLVATGKLVKGEEMVPEENEDGEQIFTDTSGKTVTLSELLDRYRNAEGLINIEQNDEEGTTSVVLEKRDESEIIATGKLVGREIMTPETNDDGDWLLTDTDGKSVTYSELESRYVVSLGVAQDNEAGTSSVELSKDGKTEIVATGKLVDVPMPEQNEDGEYIFTDTEGNVVTYGDLLERYLYSGYGDRDGRIGNYAFSGCKQLCSVAFSDSSYEWNIGAVGDYAFADCENLENPVGSSATSIGNSAFRGCKSFTNTWLWLSSAISVGDSAFRDCVTLEMVQFYGAVSIGAYAFAGCARLNDISMPETLESVGAHAFSDCPSLGSASYNGTQEQWGGVQLGEGAFPDGLTIECSDSGNPGGSSQESFSGSCGENLTWELDRDSYTLYIRGSGKMDDYKLDVNDEYPEDNPWVSTDDWMISAFIRYVFVEDGVESIGEYAFRGLDGIRSVVLPASLTKIGAGAFSSFYTWSENALSGFYYTGTDAQWNAVDIQDETILDVPCYAGDTRECGDNLSWDLDFTERTLTISGTGNMRDYEQDTSAPWSAFSNFISILVVEDGVTSIGEYAFAGLNVGQPIVRGVNEDGEAIPGETEEEIPASDTLIIPDSVESIGKGAFAGCGMESFDIPSKVTAIAAYTFENCSSLKTVSIPDGVTSVGEYAFSGCQNLGLSEEYWDERTSEPKTRDNPVILPAALTSIGNNAFEGCTAMTAVTLPASLTRLGASAFKDCAKLKSVRIPGGVTNPGASAFANCADMTSAFLENGVKTVKEGLFSACANLDNVYIPASVTAVQRNAFSGCTALYQVSFGGSEAEWKAISIGPGNEPLESENLNVTYNVAQTNETASLEISGMDNVTVTLGMPLDISGMTVTAVDTAGGREAVTGYSVYGFNSGRLGKQSIGVKYLTAETSFDITVVEPYVTEIALSAPPVRRSYAQGEALDLRGLTLEAKYSDNSVKYFTEGFEASGYDKDKVGAQAVTISYEGKETLLTVEVIAPRPNVAPPKISVTAYPGGKTISLTSETKGASVYYTTDGGNPAESGTLYAEPFALTASATLKVCAVLDGASSDVTSVPITVEQVAAVTADKSGATDAGSSVTLETATPGASIWYGPDAEHMTQLYTGGIVVDKNMDICAVARKDGWRDSEIFRASYTVNAAAVSDEVNVSLGNSDSRAGENCAMPVYLFSAEDKDVASFQISIAYDASTFAYDSISPAEGVENLFLNAEQGKVTVQYNILQNEAEARLPAGEVFTLNFRTLDSAEDGAFNVTVSGEPLVRMTGSDAAAKTRNQDGVITLKGSHNSQLTVQSAVLTDSAGNNVNASEQTAARMNVTLDPDDKQGGLDTILNVIQIFYDSNNMMVSMQMWETNLTLTGFIFSQDIEIPAGKDIASAKLLILTDDLSPSIPSMLM